MKKKNESDNDSEKGNEHQNDTRKKSFESDDMMNRNRKPENTFEGMHPERLAQLIE